MEKVLNDLYVARYALVIIVLYMFLMQLIFGNVCPVKVFLHHDCPGCGLSRATIELLKGNINKSLDYNPTCIGWLSTIILFIIDRYIKPLKIKPFPSMFICISIITILWFIFIK